MNRNLMLAGLAIVLLIVAGVVLIVLQLQTQSDLGDAHDAATQSAGAYLQTLNDNQATATQSAQEAAAVQAGLENDLAAQGTQQSNLQASATQSADHAAEVEKGLGAALAAQQAAYAAQSTVQSNVVATATQSAADASAVQVGLEDDLATQGAAFDAQGTQQSNLEATATQDTRNAAATQAAQSTQQNNLEATATQSTGNAAATQIAMETAMAQDGRNARATQTALNRQLATQYAVQDDLQEENAALAATLSAETALLATADTYSASLEATLSAQPAPPDVPVIAPPPATVSDEPVASVAVGDLIFRDDFNADSLWPTGTLTGAGYLELNEGQYWVVVNEAPSSIEGMALPIITDAYIEAEIYFEDCPSDGLFALSMRVADQDDEFVGYYFTLTCDLHFWSIDAYTGQGNLANLAFNVFTPAADDAQRRHIMGAWVAGDTLRFYLDGAELGSATSDAFSSGFVGVYAESADNPVTVRLESVRVWRLP